MSAILSIYPLLVFNSSPSVWEVLKSRTLTLGGLDHFVYSRVLIYNSSVRIHSTYILLWREGRERELINKFLSPSVYLSTITYYLLFLGS